MMKGKLAHRNADSVCDGEVLEGIRLEEDIAYIAQQYLQENKGDELDSMRAPFSLHLIIRILDRSL